MLAKITSQKVKVGGGERHANFSINCGAFVLGYMEERREHLFEGFVACFPGQGTCS